MALRRAGLGRSGCVGQGWADGHPMTTQARARAAGTLTHYLPRAIAAFRPSHLLLYPPLSPVLRRGARDRGPETPK
jgi:hypothetical protein